MCDLYVNSKIMLALFYEISTIASVSIDASYPGKSDDKDCHKSVCRLGIMDIGRSCVYFQDISVLVCYYVMFHTFDLLIAVNSLLGTRKSGTGTSLSMAPMVGCGDSPLLSLTFSTRLSSRSENASIAPQRLK